MKPDRTLSRGWPALALALAVAIAGATVSTAVADETCVSPYSPKITGQEDFVYVWILGVEGVGDEQDKLVTVGTHPQSDTYGQVIHSLSVGGRNEAHHSGYTDNRRYLWAGGLDTNKIFIFDVHTDPAAPRLAKVIDDFVAASGGAVGPHSFFALPGRMMISALSNDRDHGGRTALVEYTNEGEFIATYWMPTDDNLQGAERTGNYAFDARHVATFEIGSQVNMVSQSWDGKRLYFTSSLLGNWDKKGDADQQFLKMFHFRRRETDSGLRDRLLPGETGTCASDDVQCPRPVPKQPRR